MLHVIEAGKGALVGDLIEFLIRVVAKASFRFGDAEFWTWAAIIGGSAVALALVVWAIRASGRA